ncbi:hypothetical protein COR50_13195 [Chitinophaga caeni]|uniref:DUF4595 domain-containing protein n=1 Tax=Chitinophaga caeni TaxID=2029983 RepID=A0A291QVT7_9BACT|nr:hypothetical protein [Chitinophaga caeni]ATL48045.1 hypothetical protein COR50_13195 [Chitinophaga caeni]
MPGSFQPKWLRSKTYSNDKLQSQYFYDENNIAIAYWLYNADTLYSKTQYEYSYYPDGKMKSKVYINRTNSLKRTFSYNDNGSLIKIEDSLASTSTGPYTFYSISNRTLSGNKLTDERTFAAGGNSYMLKEIYTYDNQDNLIKEEHFDIDDPEYNYVMTYDNFSELVNKNFTDKFSESSKRTPRKYQLTYPNAVPGTYNYGKVLTTVIQVLSYLEDSYVSEELVYNIDEDNDTLSTNHLKFEYIPVQ